MKKLILLILISLVFVGCKKEKKEYPFRTWSVMIKNKKYGIVSEKMMKYDIATCKMVKKGMYKTALQRHIWFLNYAQTCHPYLRDLAFSDALHDWKRFGEKYPPALRALKDIRDKVTKRVLQSADTLLYEELIVINDELKENLNSISLFETLEKKYPSLAYNYWARIEGTLYAANRYDLIKKYIGTPQKEYLLYKNGLDYNLSDPKESEDMKEFCKKNFAENCTKLIQYCLAVNDLASAKEIQKKALAAVYSDDLANVIRFHKAK